MNRIVAAPPSLVPLQGDLRGSHAGEEFAHLFEELQQMCGDRGCIAVTSAGSGEGKSTVAANLALAIAAQHHSVLLVDFSFRRPSLERIFGESPLTYDVADALQRVDRLDFAICARTDVGLHLAMLKSPVRRQVEAQAAAPIVKASALKYEWVLLDCEPVLESRNFYRVAEVTNATVLVVRERTTKKRALAAAWAQCTPEKTLVCLNQHRG